jgi:type II secretory pathway pseudopilin PulG
LIELLVVVAIVAVLAALLIPALSQTKASAKSAVCKSNLHHIGLALKLYVDDYGAYPCLDILPRHPIDQQELKRIHRPMMLSNLRARQNTRRSRFPRPCRPCREFADSTRLPCSRMDGLSLPVISFRWTGSN